MKRGEPRWQRAVSRRAMKHLLCVAYRDVSRRNQYQRRCTGQRNGHQHPHRRRRGQVLRILALEVPVNENWPAIATPMLVFGKTQAGDHEIAGSFAGDMTKGQVTGTGGGQAIGQ